MVACPYFASGWWFVELTKLRRSFFLAWLVVQTTHKNYHTRHINVHRYIRWLQGKIFFKRKRKNHHDSGCSVMFQFESSLQTILHIVITKRRISYSASIDHPFSLVVLICNLV